MRTIELPAEKREISRTNAVTWLVYLAAVVAWGIFLGQVCAWAWRWIGR